MVTDEAATRTAATTATAATTGTTGTAGTAACVFCSIARGETPAQFVLEAGDDESCLAFLDQRPLFKGHTLLIPRVHHETLTDLPADLLAPLFANAQRLAATMEAVLGAAGSFVAINNRVSQSVPHLHIHVVPRNRKDGLKGFFWPRTRYESDEEMADYAARLRDGLAVGSDRMA